MRYLICLATGMVLLTACGPDPQPVTQPSAPEPTIAFTSEPTDPPAPSESVSEAPTEAAAPFPSEPAAAEPPPQGANVVEAWYVRAAPRGPYVEPEERILAEHTTGVARAALTEVVEGDPADPALSTLAPAGTQVLDVVRRDSVIVLDVSSEVDQSGAGSAQEIAFSQQLAHTAAQFDGVRSLRLLVDGERITELWGHLDWSKPVRPDEFAISPVIVTTPGHAETVAGGRLRTTGTANVFEATVILTLRDPNGDVHKKTFTTATCGSGCRGDWKKSFRGVTAPGRWVLIAEESDPSGGEEGGPPFKTRRAFTVE